MHLPFQIFLCLLLEACKIHACLCPPCRMEQTWAAWIYGLQHEIFMTTLRMNGTWTKQSAVTSIFERSKCQISFGRYRVSQQSWLAYCKALHLRSGVKIRAAVLSEEFTWILLHRIRRPFHCKTKTSHNSRLGYSLGGRMARMLLEFSIGQALIRCWKGTIRSNCLSCR